MISQFTHKPHNLKEGLENICSLLHVNVGIKWLNFKHTEINQLSEYKSI